MNSFEEKSKRSYNQKADQYDDSMEGQYTVPFKKLLLDEARINSGDTILDVACGNGTLLKMLSKNHDIHGFGTDISEQMIYHAKKKCPDMTFVEAGCSQIPFKDQLFDTITVCAAYHHFPDVKAFAREADRLLKPNGMIYIADVYYPDIIRILCNPFVPLSSAGDVKFYSPKQIATNFETYGFKQVRQRLEGHIQIIVMQK